MAAIYDENGTVDLNKLAADIREQLPAYARPQFIRILTKIDLTGIKHLHRYTYDSKRDCRRWILNILIFLFAGTFKLKKKDLQDEGFNAHKIQDKLYYLDAKLGYQLLTPDMYDNIQQGQIKF